MTSRTAQLVCGAFLMTVCLPGTVVAQRRQERPPRRLGSPPSRPQMPEILRRVVAAAASLRIMGQRVVDQRVQGQLVRHEENVLRVGNRTRIWFPAGSRFSGQIIVDNGNSRWRYNPRNQELHQEPSQQDDTLARLVGPNHNLLTPRVQLAEGGIIAGTSTTLARILNGKGQTVQELYIDPSTGAVLKRVGYNGSGEVVANYEFTTVDYNPAFNAADFEPPRSPKPTQTPESSVKRLAVASDLPALVLKSGQGFRLFNANVNKRAGVQVLHEVYLGPTARLSVFIFRAQIDIARLTDRGGKQIQAYSTQIGGATVVLVGPYPQDQLQRLAGMLTSL